MIELLAAVNKTNIQPARSANRGGSFQAELDNVLSEQKALTKELEQQKLSDNSKKIEEISESVEELKKSPDAPEAPVKSLEAVLEFISVYPEELDEESLELIASLIDSEVPDSVFPKIDFILEGVESPSPEEFKIKLEAVVSIIKSVPQPVYISEKSDILPETDFVNDEIAVYGIEVAAPVAPAAPAEPAAPVVSTAVVPEIAEAALKSVDMSAAPAVYNTAEPEFVKTDSPDAGIKLEAFTEYHGGEFVKPDKSSGDSQFGEQSEQPEQSVKTIDIRSAEETAVFENIEAQETNIEKTVKIEKTQSLVLPQQVDAMLQNVAGKISIMMQDKLSELRMKMTPPEYGTMKINLITEDGLMRGKVIVETPEARMLFEQNIDNLRDSLAAIGISLGSIDVELGNPEAFEEDEELKIGNAAERKGEMPVIREAAALRESIIDYTA